jgi:hypothetical protein
MHGGELKPGMGNMLFKHIEDILPRVGREGWPLTRRREQELGDV